MRIVPLEPEFLPVVTPLLYRAVLGSEAAFDSEAAAQHELTEAMKSGRRSPWCVLVASDQGGVQGVAVSGPKLPATRAGQADDAELRMLAAFPDGSGRRLGQRLLDEMRRELRTRGATALWARGRPQALSALCAAGAVVVRERGDRALVRLQVSAWPEELETERLHLRSWHPLDAEPFAQLNAHPDVMRYFPAPLSREESDALLERFQAELCRSGFGHWAMSLKTPEGPRFVGFAGLSITEGLPFSPLPELSYRLSPEAWGKGLATEAGRALIQQAERLGFEELVAMTTAGNRRSQRVMERLGMTRDGAGDFDHPRLPAGHRLSRHMLYRLPLAAREASAREASSREVR